MATPITDVKVATYVIPTDFPESDGTFAWDKTTLVLVEARVRDVVGIGFTYADDATARLVDGTLASLVRGRDAMGLPNIWTAMVQAIRNLGRPGIASMAVAAVDAALWDLKARLLQIPLVTLLGAARTRIPVYGSGGFTSYPDDHLCAQLAGWAERGIGRVKMKVGRDAQADRRRVALARDAIGTLDSPLRRRQRRLLPEASGSAQALAFAASDVTWFEEPVSSDDLAGLRLLRDHGPAGMDIAAGEYGYDLDYFRQMLAADAVDVVQADASRCGGITGFLRVSALCEAHHLRLSAHCAPSLHATWPA